MAEKPLLLGVFHILLCGMDRSEQSLEYIRAFGPHAAYWSQDRSVVASAAVFLAPALLSWLLPGPLFPSPTPPTPPSAGHAAGPGHVRKLRGVLPPEGVQHLEIRQLGLGAGPGPAEPHLPRGAHGVAAGELREPGVPRLGEASWGCLGLNGANAGFRAMPSSAWTMQHRLERSQAI